VSVGLLGDNLSRKEPAGDDGVLTVVSSAFVTEDGEVQQVFDVTSFNSSDGEVVLSMKLVQLRSKYGRPLLTCTASDPNEHTLYYFQTYPASDAYALYNITSTTPGEWYHNTTFSFSSPKPQREITGVCQATRFSGFPEEHNEDTYVWFNPTTGPILAIDASNG